MTAVTNPNPPLQSAPAVTIPPREAADRRAAAGGATRIIDVRTPPEYAALHVDGAESIPLDRLDPAAVMAAAPADGPLYVVCQSGGRAARACEMFRAAGYPHVFSIAGGTEAWAAAGLPVARAAAGAGAVISLERQVRIGAGALVLLGIALGWFVHPAFLGLSAFVGGGLVFAGVTGWCGMGLLLARLPWNR